MFRNDRAQPTSETTLTRIFGPLIWVTVIIGAPVLAVMCDHMAASLFPENLLLRRTLVWGCFLVLHGTYTFMLQRQLRAVIHNLIEAKTDVPDTKPSKTASTIATAVALGLTLIAALVLLDYYGHRGAADFASRIKIYEDEKADREKESSHQQVLQPELIVIPATEAHPRSAERTSPKLQGGHAVPGLREQLKGYGVAFAIPPQPFAPEPAKTELVKPEPSALEVTGGFLGTFGDFFGGVLNPLLTFGTLVALAITIFLQRTQLDLAEQSASRNSAVMEKQAFETTFFNMLNLHNTTVQDLKFDPKTIEIPIWNAEEPEDGNAIADEGDEEYDDDEYDGEIDYDNRDPDALLSPLNMANAEGRQVFARVLQLMDSKLHNATPTAVYHRIQKYHNYVLGHYFRTLYQLLELVEEYSEAAGYEEATRYSSIVRAQLSANELILLFFNCGYELVDSGQFRKLLKRYEILEHMPLRPGPEEGTLDTPGYTFFIEKHIKQYFKRPEDGDTVHSEAGAFGENPVVRDYLKQIQ